MVKKILITGGAGFIGSHLIDKLMIIDKYEITCLDNFNDFYPPQYKRDNISKYLTNDKFKLIIGDICQLETYVNELSPQYDVVIHLAAMAGVRPSISNPSYYQYVNVVGLQNILEIARKKNVKQFIYASSSSVYGINQSYPWKEDGTELMPISPYATSKIAGEWLGKAFSTLYGIRFVALRFFTVYGPRQRPDLAINSFVRKILNDEPIDFYGDGSTLRDYTFVSDTVNGILSAIFYKDSQYEIFNLGNNKPVSLKNLVTSIEAVIGKKAKFNNMPMQQGDVPITYADIEKAGKLLNYKPEISLVEGLNEYYKFYLNNLK